MSRIANLIRWPWRKRKPESSVAVGVLGINVYIHPPEPPLAPNQIRSFLDPNKIITAEPKEPVSQ